MDWVLPALGGFALGLLSSSLILLVQRRWQEQRDATYTKNVLRSLVLETEEGLGRAKGMVRQLDSGQVSLGRIYTGLWDTTSERLAATLSDVEALALLHRIYYRFDLVNFNCDRGELVAAAAFAKEYMTELEANFCRLSAMVEHT